MSQVPEIPAPLTLWPRPLPPKKGSESRSPLSEALDALFAVIGRYASVSRSITALSVQ